MNYYGDAISHLIDELARLPGVGRKTAQRLAFYIIDQPEEDALRLASVITTAKREVKYCTKCCTITDGDLCPICASPSRRDDLIMVVEDPRDMAAYERTNQFDGRYHILHGAISPMAGVGPSDLKIKELVQRVGTEGVNEIIIATNPNVEGEATAMYIAKLLKPLGVKVTRIANGVPVGGDLEYIDEVTLSRALEGRVEL